MRTWLLVFLAVPLFLWGLLNLVFSTAWGTGFLERQIEARLGLPCQIESVTWSPWAGVQVRSFRILTSEDSSEKGDILQISEIAIDPSWTSMIKGQKKWERLEMRDLSGAISLEQLGRIFSRYQKRRPAMVLAQSSSDPALTKNEEKAPVPDGSMKNPEQPEKSKGMPEKVPERNDQFTEKESQPVDDFEGTVVVKNANYRVYSERSPKVSVQISDVNGEVPMWGKERAGELRVGKLEFADQFAEGSLTFPLRWSDRYLRLDKYTEKLFGLNVEITAAFRLVEGIPAGLQINLPDQDVDLTPIFLEGNSPVEIGQISSANSLQGYLFNPGSFRGTSLTLFSDLVFHDPRDGGGTRFDRGSASLKVTSAGLVADDIRAVGEEDAILMNGFATAGGEAAATMRIVSSPERADSHEKRIRMASPSLTFNYQPLITPDREYRDIRIEARSGILAMDLGVEEQWVPLIPLVRSVLGGAKLPTAPLP